MRGAVVVSLAIMLAVASCGGNPDESGSTSEERTTAATTSPESPSPAPEPSPSGQERPEPSGTLVRTASSSDYGTMLFDESGQAIYLFDRETSERPRCYGPCAASWPPVLTKGEPQAGRQARSGLLATTERRDGTLQVTYAGHPLYYYAHEGKNEVLCHNVDEFGGTWLVIRPNGEAAP